MDGPVRGKRLQRVLDHAVAGELDARRERRGARRLAVSSTTMPACRARQRARGRRASAAARCAQLRRCAAPRASRASRPGTRAPGARCVANVSRACSALCVAPRLGQRDHRLQRPPRRGVSRSAAISARSTSTASRALVLARLREQLRALGAARRRRGCASARGARSTRRRRTAAGRRAAPASSCGSVNSSTTMPARISASPASAGSPRPPRGDAEEDQQRGRDRDAAARLIDSVGMPLHDQCRTASAAAAASGAGGARPAAA